jgi:hypothetical protein
MRGGGVWGGGETNNLWKCGKLRRLKDFKYNIIGYLMELLLILRLPARSYRKDCQLHKGHFGLIKQLPVCGHTVAYYKYVIMEVARKV